MLRTQPLFRDDGMMIGDLLPAQPSAFDIGSPTLPIRNIYADNIIGAITTLANGEWIQGLDSGGVAVDLLRIDATNDTELNAKTGRSIQLQINNLTRWSVDSAGQFVQDATNGSNLVLTKASTGILSGAAATIAGVTGISGTPALYSVKGAADFSSVWIGASADAVGARVGFFKTRAVTAVPTTIVAASDVLGAINFYGADGVAYIPGARIQAIVSATPGANDMPTDLELWNTPDGAAASLRTWIFKSDGNLLADNTTTLEVLIGKNSADNADTGAIAISSGTAASKARGGYLKLWGNEHGSAPAQAVLSAGNAAGDLYLIVPQGAIRMQTGSAGVEANRIIITGDGSINLDRTNTAAGTTGNQVIDKMAGSVNIAAGGTTITVTNALVTAASNVFAVVQTGDATALLKNVVPGAGSFVINMNAAVTAETRVAFWVTN